MAFRGNSKFLLPLPCLFRLLANSHLREEGADPEGYLTLNKVCKNM